ncbi:hypothetical protein EAF00_003883 [Botryotinia globosa]|nr:hypothetical protein EAF00_003883 [Botryotinia globosa]
MYSREVGISLENYQHRHWIINHQLYNSSTWYLVQKRRGAVSNHSAEHKPKISRVGNRKSEDREYKNNHCEELNVGIIARRIAHTHICLYPQLIPKPTIHLLQLYTSAVHIGRTFIFTRILSIGNPTSPKIHRRLLLSYLRPSLTLNSDLHHTRNSFHIPPVERVNPSKLQTESSVAR